MKPHLPKQVKKLRVPPVKCQGIKTHLVRFIAESVSWDGKGRWIEPFLGSGVVVLNIRPPSALLSDTNPHIIRFYEAISTGEISSGRVRSFLTEEGKRLFESSGEYYYEVRERFNQQFAPLDFLFLSRSCFNGLMRFNKKGKFNVPFCKKPDRFRQAYVTKIVNQVQAFAEIAGRSDWEFRVADWRETLKEAREGDFVYLDPPYIGRHTNYYDQWDDANADALAEVTQTLPCGYALSMWRRNRHRNNAHIDHHWSGAIERTTEHFYHVGSSESLRNEMIEALLIKPGFEAPLIEAQTKEPIQLEFLI
jgi:DNA adenine methylase